MNEFEEADADAGVLSAQVVKREETSIDMPQSGVVEFREKLVEKYYEGRRGLVEALRVGASDASLDAILWGLIEQVLKETDHLLGNELVATHNGDLRDASVISFKRAEVLEKAIKAVSTKRELEKESGIDLESPMMEVVFRYFMEKTKEALDAIKVGNDANDLFFRTIMENTSEWKKELKNRMISLRNGAG